MENIILLCFDGVNMKGVLNIMKKKNAPVITGNVVTVEYENEMKKSFIDYAMTVIVQRALPDVRDGLKPVQRRILYGMLELGVYPDKSYRKSARIVGDVMGKFHPHGDSSIYEAMVRMAQDFRMKIPLVNGHGNFGSIDGDGAAAMRYTEAKLDWLAMELLSDLDKNVVDFKDNFDGTEKEPLVLPANFPNLFLNGATGIAVGMKTDIPTHNLVELTKAIIRYIDNPKVSTAQLMKHMKGPDFPTGGIITNRKDLLKMYETGKGKVTIRAKIEKEKAEYGKTNLVITEIPFTYSGNKSKLIEKIEMLAKDKKLEELSDIRDESSKDGIRLVLEVKKGVDVEKFLNKLYKMTPLEDNYNANFLAIVDGRPKVLSLKEYFDYFVRFQKEITTRKYQYLLNKAKHRQEILDGLIKAIDMIDLIIEILRGSKDTKSVRECLMYGKTDNIQFKTKKSEKQASKLSFTEAQTKAILDMRLERLIGLEIEKLTEEHATKEKEIERYTQILSNEQTLLEVIKEYLNVNAKKFGKKRKTVIDDIETEDYVEEFKEEEIYALVDRFGYVKSMDVSSFNRVSEDTIKEFKHVLSTKNTDKITLFTKEGNVHQVKLLDVPKGKVKDKGVPIDTLVKMGKEETLLVDTVQHIKYKRLMFITKHGLIKIVNGNEFETNRSTMTATKLEEGDELVSVSIVDEDSSISHVVVVSNEGFALKFAVDEVPTLKKTSKGVKTITLAENDFVEHVFFVNVSDTENIVEIQGRAVDLQSLKVNKRNAIGVKLL